MNVASSLIKPRTSRTKSLIKLCAVSIRMRQTFNKNKLGKMASTSTRAEKKHLLENPLEHSA